MKLTRLPYLLLFFILSACCHPVSSATENLPEVRPADQIHFTGTVRHQELEGGFFGLVADDGRRFDPVDLPESFRREGLRVQVTGRLLPASIGFHMWGTRISIVQIEEAATP